MRKTVLAAALAAVATVAALALPAAAAEMKPGTYEIVTRGNNGPLTVTTTLGKHSIENVVVGENFETDYIALQPMKDVAAKIVADQTLSVDTVSGATRSTTALLRAVGEAVEKAGGDTADFTKDTTPIDPNTLPLSSVETDVVVVGAGGTGMAAAARAAELGAKVVVLEKMGLIGGSSALSGGAIAAAGSKAQARAGIDDTPEAFAKLWLDDQKSSVPGGEDGYPEIERVKALARESAATVDWLEGTVGLRFAKPRPFGFGGPERAHAPAASPVPENGRGSTAGGGAYVISALKKYTDARGVPVRTNTAAYELMTNAAGDVTGVRAHDGKNRYEFKAKAVVLATGGFARNVEMLVERAPRWVTFTDWTASAKGSTGDGLRMALDAGAAEAKDSWMIGLYLVPKYPILASTYTSKDKYKDRVFVNERGERFVDESRPYVTDPAAMQGQVWAIVDGSNPKKTEILKRYLTYDVAVHGESWSELGRRMALTNPSALEKTMNTYNADCEKGRDSAFGKDPAYMKPFTTGPFFAVRVLPGTGGTIGGVVTNERFQVLRPDGSVIKGLYAGGEMANRPFYDRVYTSGTGLAVAYTSGRIAGENAAREH